MGRARLVELRGKRRVFVGGALAAVVGNLKGETGLEARHDRKRQAVPHAASFGGARRVQPDSPRAPRRLGGLVVVAVAEARRASGLPRAVAPDIFSGGRVVGGSHHVFGVHPMQVGLFAPPLG